MKLWRGSWLRPWCVWGLAGIVLGLNAAAGIPEPGLILYGAVRDANGVLITNGELQWAVTPEDGGPALVVTTSLRRIEGAGGPLSYIVHVPAERAVEGSPVSAGALPITDAAVGYRREATLNGLKLAAHGPSTLMLSYATRGTATRIDVGGLAQNNFFDVNGDERMDAVDIQLVINAALGLGIGPMLPFADVNFDGVVDAIDVQLIINGVLGIPNGGSPASPGRGIAVAHARSPAGFDGAGGDDEVRPASTLAAPGTAIPTVPPGAPLGGAGGLLMMAAALAGAGWHALRRNVRK